MCVSLSEAVAGSFLHTQACCVISMCVSLSELLLESPRSGMCAPERAVSWSFSTLRCVVCVSLSEAIAGSFSTLRHVVLYLLIMNVCMYKCKDTTKLRTLPSTGHFCLSESLKTEDTSLFSIL